MVKRILSFVVIATFVLVVPCAFAQTKEHKTPPKPPMMRPRVDRIQLRVDRLTQELNLTADQQAKVKEILTKSEEESKKILDEARQRTQEVRNKANNEIADILTPEQKAKFHR